MFDGAKDGGGGRRALRRPPRGPHPAPAVLGRRRHGRRPRSQGLDTTWDVEQVGMRLLAVVGPKIAEIWTELAAWRLLNDVQLLGGG